jgi:GNAT superfamily N-acetyltransferase
MSDLLIRAATPSDADTITRFNLAMAHETERRALDEQTVRAGVLGVLNDPTRGVYYVAERGGNLVGQMMVTYEWSDWRNGVFWWIQSVYVRPEARGAGVYRALHEWVAQLARRNERVRGLRLYVERENVNAQRVYERMGMSRTRYDLFEVDWASGGGHAAQPPGTPAPSEAPQPQPATEITIDLYCLKCGYNLRGLTGDPCRCPECGNLNPRGDMELPAPLIARQLREMESGPAYCLLAVAFVAVIAVVAVLAPRPILARYAALLTVITLVAAAAWIGCAGRFSGSCLGKPGWFSTLMRYHAAGLISLAVVVAVPLGSALLLRQAVGRVFDATAMLTYTVVMIGIAAALAALLYMAVKPLHRLAKGRMEELQREVAVDIARRTLRRRLAGRGGGWFE